MAALAEARKQEIERGVTLVGPHRDDLLLKLGSLPAKGYASHGESWSYAGAAAGLVRPAAGRGERAGAGAGRRVRRAGRAAPGAAGGAGGAREQVLVTAAVDDDVPHVLAGARFTVAEGTVERV